LVTYQGDDIYFYYIKLSASWISSQETEVKVTSSTKEAIPVNIEDAVIPLPDVSSGEVVAHRFSLPSLLGFLSDYDRKYTVNSSLTF
jgi:hypothetical protein